MRPFPVSVFPMRNPVKNYAWGSYAGLGEYAGIRTDPDKPAAECWMGAHPSMPSLVSLPGGSALPLNALIAENPSFALGEAVAGEFGELPFLFKVLSASMPLSIQVHPGKAAAEAGFARENAGGIPAVSPDRNYRDSQHKPELAVALSRFEALAGFRPAEETARLLGPALRSLFSFDAGHPEASLRRLLGKALRFRSDERQFLESEAKKRAAQLSALGEPADVLAAERVISCFDHYPGDPGAIAPFFMNIFALEPGQGMYMAPGVLHAYLRGTILEIMAASDNVIRGGLTQKHIDVDELLSIIDFGASPRPIAAAKIGKTVDEREWAVPAREFRLSGIRLSGSARGHFFPRGPEILLCTEGEASLYPASGKGEAISFARGQSVFVSASTGSYCLGGEGNIYRARTGAIATGEAAPAEWPGEGQGE